jgi:predicted transcriptional regulator
VNERHALAVQLRTDGKTQAEIAVVLGVSRGRIHQMLKTASQRRLEAEAGEAGPFSSLHQRVRKHLLNEFPRDAYPPLSKVREMMESGTLKKVPNLGKLSIQIIEDWLQIHGA